MEQLPGHIHPGWSFLPPKHTSRKRQHQQRDMYSYKVPRASSGHKTVRKGKESRPGKQTSGATSLDGPQIPRKTFRLNGNYHSTLNGSKAQEPDGWEPLRNMAAYFSASGRKRWDSDYRRSDPRRHPGAPRELWTWSPPGWAAAAPQQAGRSLSAPEAGQLGNEKPTKDQLKHAYMAMAQDQWYNFGIGAPPILVYFSGDWDVHWVRGFDQQKRYQNGLPW